jgi:hypothetical protein
MTRAETGRCRNREMTAVATAVMAVTTERSQST